MAEEARHEAIVPNVEKLIECLIGDTFTEQEKCTLQQEAMHKIRHHRNLSVNSHQVRRAIDNLITRFHDEGMSHMAEAVQMLSTEIINHADWDKQYVVDAQYSLLDFLISITSGPVQHVRRNPSVVEQRIQAIRAALESARQAQTAPNFITSVDENGGGEGDAKKMEDWVALLKEDFILQGSDGQESDSSLSDWSDVDDEDDVLKSPDAAATQNNCLATLQSNIKQFIMPNLRELQRPKSHTDYMPAAFEESHLGTVVHSTWWRPDVQFHAQTENNDPCSNFGIAYVQHLNRESQHPQPLPNTPSENSLLRDIIFMFFAPTSCAFFELLPDAEQQQQQLISVRKNITISSMSSETLFNVLKTEVLPALQAKHELHGLINELTNDMRTPGTLCSFGWGLFDLLQPINAQLIKFERRLIDQAEGTLSAEDATNCTLMAFLRFIGASLQRLLLLKALANEAIGLRTAPAYLQSLQLLCVLYEHTLHVDSQQQLAIALLMVSLQSYSRIMDNWWRLAQLRDPHLEYIVDCVPVNCADYGQRIEERMSQEEMQPELRDNALYQLLLQHAMEAGETQDLLASAQLLSDIMLNSNELGSHYDDLKQHLLQQLGSETALAADDADDADDDDALDELSHYEKAVLEQSEQLGDPQLMSIFTMHITEAQEKPKSKKLPLVLQVLRRLESNESLLQSQLLPRCLVQVHNARYALANVHVMRWYRDELQLGEHVRVLRQLMLFEADHLLYPFYVSLFCQMEDGQQDWACGSLLTLELNDLLDVQHAAHSSLVSVRLVSRLRCQSDKVYEALEAIRIEYDLPTPLRRIITQQQLLDYNAIWRMVLKVKWAAWKLEHMRVNHRHRNGYGGVAPLDLFSLTLRRLCIVRFWFINLINSLHAHLCIDVIQTLGVQFEQLLSTAKTTRQLRQMHDNYIRTLMQHCMLTPDFTDFHITLDQVFHLIFVLDLEWTSCCSYHRDLHALSLDTSGETSTTNDDDAEYERGAAMEYLASNQVNEIESTYIRCHQKLGEILTALVNNHDHKFLNSLEVAINASLPC